MLEFERMFGSDKEKNLTLRVSRAIAPLYVSEDREWGAAKIYEGCSLCHIAVMRKKRGEIWDEYIDDAIDVFKEVLIESKMDKIYTSDIQICALSFLIQILPTYEYRLKAYQYLKSRTMPSQKRTESLKILSRYNAFGG